MAQPSSAAQFVISWHRPLDYTPGVSTVVNLAYLFQRCVVDCVYAVHSDVFRANRFLEKLSSNEYATHLFQNKSYGRCLVLLVPILGNVVIALYDWKVKRDAIRAVAESYAGENRTFHRLSPWLQSDKDVLDAAIAGVVKDFEKRDYRISYSNLPEYLRKKPRVIEAARQNNQVIDLSELDDSYKRDPNFAADVVKNSAHQFEYVDPFLKWDKTFVFSLLHKFTHQGRFEFDDRGGHESSSKREHNETILKSLKTSHPQLFADEDFLYDLLKIDCRMHIFIQPQIYTDRFFRRLVKLQPRVLEWLSPDQRKDLDFMRKMHAACAHFDKAFVINRAADAVGNELLLEFRSEFNFFHHGRPPLKFPEDIGLAAFGNIAP